MKVHRLATSQGIHLVLAQTTKALDDCLDNAVTNKDALCVGSYRWIHKNLVSGYDRADHLRTCYSGTHYDGSNLLGTMLVDSQNLCLEKTGHLYTCKIFVRFQRLLLYVCCMLIELRG